MNKTIGPAEDSAHHDLHAHRISQEAAREMLAGLKDLFAMMDEGILVRNTDNDGDPNWAMKLINIGSRISKAYSAIARAEANK